MKRSGNTQHLSHIQQPGRLLQLLSLDQTDIYFTKNQINFNDIAKLEREFEEKYDELSKLESSRESEEYQRLRAELFRIDEEIDNLLWR